MSHTTANILMLIASLIWGTAFVAQKTGMDFIGPFTFSFSRFFFAMITVLPFVIIWERKHFAKIIGNKKLSLIVFYTGIALFGGMGLQQYALLKSQISNASFLSTLYVPFVTLISRFIFKSHLSWIIWTAVLLCLYGSYLLSSNQSYEVQRSDALLFVAALFFAIHIILVDVFMKKFYSPFTFSFCQYFIVPQRPIFELLKWEEISNNQILIPKIGPIVNTDLESSDIKLFYYSATKSNRILKGEIFPEIGINNTDGIRLRLYGTVGVRLSERMIIQNEYEFDNKGRNDLNFQGVERGPKNGWVGYLQHSSLTYNYLKGHFSIGRGNPFYYNINHKV